jgi:alkanesulfonate monooxygenase SsuD/methylene tetrahydromethanopterin reductase-like flavin-dependent oxidoreductase (luciferase family)
MSADEANRFGHELEPLEKRLARLVETIAAIRSAAPEVPIWVGGRHDLVRQAAARYADGWNAWGAPLAELRSEVEEVRALAGSKPFTISWGGTLLLAPDEAALAKQIAERGGSQGTIAGTPSVIKGHLQDLGQVVDELVVSIVPNRPPSWELFARSVLSG